MNGLSSEDKQIVEEFRQFLKWAKSPETAADKAPYRYLAWAWYQGLITIDEGRYLEGSQRLAALMK